MKDPNAPRPTVAYTPFYMGRVARRIVPRPPIVGVEVMPGLLRREWVALVSRQAPGGEVTCEVEARGSSLWEVLGALRDLS